MRGSIAEPGAAASQTRANGDSRDEAGVGSGRIAAADFVGLIKRMMASTMALASPHMRELGIRFVSVERGAVVAVLPYRRDLVGDPLAGILHGGVVTSLLDSAGGAAVISMLALPAPIATLDLRIDYLRPSTPEAPLYAAVECYKLTRSVAFTRGTAYNHDRSDPVASMAATFMRTTQSLPHGKEHGDG
jgi:uncharacterized protein (TIGR00369 family)